MQGLPTLASQLTGSSSAASRRPACISGLPGHSVNPCLYARTASSSWPIAASASALRCTALASCPGAGGAPPCASCCSAACASCNASCGRPAAGQRCGSGAEWLARHKSTWAAAVPAAGMRLGAYQASGPSGCGCTASAPARRLPPALQSTARAPLHSALPERLHTASWSTGQHPHPALWQPLLALAVVCRTVRLICGLPDACASTPARAPSSPAAFWTPPPSISCCIAFKQSCLDQECGQDWCLLPKTCSKVTSNVAALDLPPRCNSRAWT